MYAINVMMLSSKGAKMVDKKKKTKPFNKKELKVIREVILKKKAQILEDFINLEGQSFMKSAKDASGDLSGYTFHMADMATDLYDREFSLGLAEAERERLFALDDALKRIDEGTYGICDKCGDEITKQRLKAMPRAEFCIGCQEKEEKSSGR